MSETAAALVWCVGIVLWTIIRMPYRRKAKRTAVVADRKSSSEKFALGFCIVGLVIVPALQLTTGIFDFANYQYQPFMGFLGLVAMVGFLTLFYFSHKHLASNWSVTLEIRKDHELVQHGVFHYVRHPMYTSFWLWGIAQFLLIPNWVAGSLGLISVAWLYFTRIGEEEAMMRAQFGEAYDEYSERTARLIPTIY